MAVKSEDKLIAVIAASVVAYEEAEAEQLQAVIKAEDGKKI
jgi:hypothetical protein